MTDDILVIVRCFNDAWVVGDTLDAVFGQTGLHVRVVAVDSGSTDGSVDILKRYPLQLIEIPLGTYIPGRVLNLGMRQGQQPLAAFVNSDCTPQHPEWLARLVAPLHADSRAAAVYGRQIARPHAQPLVVKDYERAFGDGTVAAGWRHFFSMASAAIRRTVWERTPFDETIRYSEDILWTWQRRQEGWGIAYAADSVAMHSHNYTLAETGKRYLGEGRADAAIFPSRLLSTGLTRGLVLPWAAESVRDVIWCLRRGYLAAAATAGVRRFVQKAAYRQGVIEGLSHD